MALVYKDHSFDVACQCCIKDAASIIDPTGTSNLRARFRASLNLKWRGLRALVRQIIDEHDLLQLKNGGLLPVKSPAVFQGASKIDGFQRWLDNAVMQRVIENDASFMRQFINDGFAQGFAFASEEAGIALQPQLSSQRIDTMLSLAKVELSGIAEAVSQQATRAVANGLLHHQRPMAIVRSIWSVIDKVAIARSNAFVDLIIVSAFNQAALDAYESAGISNVGVIPELRITPNIRDAILQDARKKAAKKKASPRRKSGPGSRSSRKQLPSASTIRRIRKAEEKIEKLGRVRVRTAGDDKVCPICEDIAAHGPYSINRARALIPAHPRCRCVFVPAKDKRFKKDHL